MKNLFYFYILKIKKKSEVVSYITLPYDQRGIVGFIMWEYDSFINKVMEREEASATLLGITFIMLHNKLI